MKITLITSRRAGSILLIATLLGVLAASGGPRAPHVEAATGSPVACSAAERSRRAASLRSFRRSLLPARRAWFRAHRSASARRLFVRRQVARLRRLERSVAACARPAPPPPQPIPPEPQAFTFYPQAGIIGRDLHLANSVDLDTGPGIQDWSCTGNAYDGHGGQDTGIRSFREQLVGVPVYAALDGRVRSVQDYEDDMNYGPTRRQTDNHVIVDHGGTQETVYGHLRRGRILVKVGQRVRAGQQVGWTASSGNSSGPHLHFGARFRLDVYEPFAGPCRPGRSLWTEQPAVSQQPYVANVTLSAAAFGGPRANWPFDEAARTGTFVLGERDVHLRVEFGNPDGTASSRVRFLRPDGSVALEAEGPPPGGHTTSWSWRTYRVALDLPGTWRIAYDLDGQALFEAPFDVVAGAGEVANRAPRPIGVTLAPTAARAADVLRCLVDTSLVTEDPDYDLVSYRYRWTAGERLLREVTSAALSDVLARDTARAGETVTCTVTPGDGRLEGPPASASSTLGG